MILRGNMEKTMKKLRIGISLLTLINKNRRIRHVYWVTGLRHLSTMVGNFGFQMPFLILGGREVSDGKGGPPLV